MESDPVIFEQVFGEEGKPLTDLEDDGPLAGHPEWQLSPAPQEDSDTDANQDTRSKTGC